MVENNSLNFSFTTENSLQFVLLSLSFTLEIVIIMEKKGKKKEKNSFCKLIHLRFFLSGVEAIVVDYIRPSLFGGKTLIPNIAQGAVWLLSGVTLGGLYYFNYTDVGIVTAIKMLWTGL